MTFQIILTIVFGLGIVGTLEKSDKNEGIWTLLDLIAYGCLIYGTWNWL